MDDNAALRFEVLTTKKDHMDLWNATPVRFLIWVLAPLAAYYIYWTYVVSVVFFRIYQEDRVHSSFLSPQ